MLKICKKCKIKVKNNAKMSKKCANYENLTKLIGFARFKKQLFFCPNFYAENLVLKNFDLILHFAKQLKSVPKTNFRASEKGVVVECVAQKIVKNVCCGKSLNEALKEEIKKAMLFKKEIAVLKRCVLLCAMWQLFFYENEIYEFKKEFLKGKCFSKTQLPKTASPAFFYGLAKNKNLGLFVLEKQKINSAIDEAFLDMEEFFEKIQILINLLIKCK